MVCNGWWRWLLCRGKSENEDHRTAASKAGRCGTNGSTALFIPIELQSPHALQRTTCCIVEDLFIQVQLELVQLLVGLSIAITWVRWWKKTELAHTNTCHTAATSMMPFTLQDTVLCFASCRGCSAPIVAPRRSKPERGTTDLFKKPTSVLHVGRKQNARFVKPTHLEETT